MEGVDCQLQEFWESRDGRFQESKANKLKPSFSIIKDEKEKDR